MRGNNGSQALRAIAPITEGERERDDERMMTMKARVCLCARVCLRASYIARHALHDVDHTCTRRTSRAATSA
jgi:hypothetical protein